MSECQRDPQQGVQRHRHDAGFDREQQKCERGIDERGQRRAHVAETGAACQQIDVDPVTAGVVRNGQADEKHDHAEGGDGPDRVLESVRHRDAGADGLAGEEGNRPESRIAYAKGGLPGPLRGKTQSEVLERLTGDPLIVLAPLPDDSLPWVHFPLRGVSRRISTRTSLPGPLPSWLDTRPANSPAPCRTAVENRKPAA